MKLRALAAGTALAVATSVGGGFALAVANAPSAAAARPATSLSGSAPCNITLPGTTTAIPSTCTAQVTSVHAVNGVLQAAGGVTSPALPSNVGLPTTSTGAPYIPFSAATLDPPAGSCSILALTLGPLHLNLLGLVVDLNQVNLNITAVPGPGNLLGNLLCAVANLLNGSGLSAALTNLLNQINTILAGL